MNLTIVEDGLINTHPFQSSDIRAQEAKPDFALRAVLAIRDALRTHFGKGGHLLGFALEWQSQNEFRPYSHLGFYQNIAAVGLHDSVGDA